MKSIKILICCLVLMLLAADLGLAQNSRELKRKKIQIELYAGHSRVNPADLNLFPDFNFMDNHQSGRRKYSFYNQVRYNYNFIGRDQGEFKKITAASPLGIRIKYFFNPKFALSAGFRLMSRTAASTFNEKFEVSHLNPDYTPFYQQFTDERLYDPANISFASYVLHLGNHHIFRLNSVWSVELFAAIGLGYATCQYEDYITAITEHLPEGSLNEYQEERTYATQYQGEGISFFSELGFRLNIQWHPRISLFLEMSGSALNFGNINGPGTYQFSYKDSNGEGYQDSWEGEGRWKVQEISYNNSWGYFSRWRPYIDEGDSVDARFELNLSGFQFRVGIGYRF